MLKSEFQKIAKVSISDDCYEQFVEKLYNESDMLKDEWVKHFMYNGGFQLMYDYERKKAEKVERELNFIKRIFDYIEYIEYKNNNK